MTQSVRLHGGPMHGKTLAIQDGQNLITIRQPKYLAAGFETKDPEKAAELIEFRHGTYSRVRLSDHDFEWDGWKP